MKIKNYILASIALSGIICFTACNDDDTYDVVGNPDNLVYVTTSQPTPANLPDNSFVYQVYHTPVGAVVASEPGEIKLRVNSTRRVNHDTQIILQASPETPVEGYAQLPASVNLDIVFSSNTLTIPAGENISNEVTITVNAGNVDWNQLKESAYLLPIKITEISGSPAKPSIDKGYAYIGIHTEVKDGMLNLDATSVDGDAVDASSFTGTWNAPDSGKSGTFDDSLFDDNSWTYAYFVANHADKVHEKVENVVDMGQVYNIKGFMLRYYFRWYTIETATIYTSVDGVEYTEQGSVTYNNDGTERYFAFWAPTAARYVKFVTTSYYSGTGEGTALSDFIVYE